MQIIINLLRGFAIGVANIIPGVSGGTVALMLGIYQRLLDAISAIGPQTITAFAGGRAAIRKEFERIDAAFLGSLAIGAGSAIVATARLMSYLLETHHDPTYGFFFGLITASLVVPWRLIKRLSPANIISCILAIVLVVGLTMAMSGEEKLKTAQKKAMIKSGTITIAVGQATGVIGGIVERKSRVEPCFSSFQKPGSLPALAHGTIKSQVALSMPKKKSFFFIFQ